MRFSITMVATDLALPVTQLARAVEERGLDGIWLPDHTHIPVSKSSPYPLGGDLPERYKRVVDPLVGLAMAAAVTTRIRVGTGIMLVSQRDPIVSAKALATLDQQSLGRLVVGIGYGWNIEEMMDHGVHPGTRRARAREHVLLMRQLWEAEVASFAGSHVRMSPSWAWPKPLQRPLPILIGGAPSSVVFDQVAEFGQGWIPVGGKGLAAGVDRLREYMSAAGRDPDLAEVVPFTTAEMDHAKVDAFEAAGATEVAFDVPPLEANQVLPILDRLASFVAARR